MAIYHLSVKPISRSAGRSATASAAYRFGVEIFCKRSGDVHDYTRRSGVESTEITLPRGAPSWANNRSELWNTVEQHETRKNSTVAREFEVSLAEGLNREQRRELVREFATELVTRHGIAVDSAIHTPGREGDDRNYHAHILTSTRRLGPDGFTEKVRELDSQIVGPKEVERWRERWADLTNKALERAGQSDRVDHRSLVAQRIEALALGDMAKAEALDREPTRHLGPVATDDLRRFNQGKKPEPATDRAREHLEIKADNAERQSLLREVREVIEWGIDQPEPQALQLARKWAMRAPAAEPGPDLTPTQETYERSSPNQTETARGRAPSSIPNMPRLSTCDSVFDKNPRRISNGASIFDTQRRKTSQRRAGSDCKSPLQTSAHVFVRKQAESHHARLHRARGQVSSSTVVETALDDLERMRPEPEQDVRLEQAPAAESAAESAAELEQGVRLERAPEPQQPELEAMTESAAEPEMDAMPESEPLAEPAEVIPESAAELLPAKPEQGMFATLRAQFKKFFVKAPVEPPKPAPSIKFGLGSKAEPPLSVPVAPVPPVLGLTALEAATAPVAPVNWLDLTDYGLSVFKVGENYRDLVVAGASINHYEHELTELGFTRVGEHFRVAFTKEFLSLRLWRQAFPNAQIIKIDVREILIDEATLQEFLEANPVDSYDVTTLKMDLAPTALELSRPQNALEAATRRPEPEPTEPTRPKPRMG